ncbi:hypothetical protein Tco_1081865 [Tanacetum coccineum]|uniref:Aminotransferase-like plant mobile domain-containing protein n=1 Tax=Tanacetum coccineum TaxID=301880 RepID=A0ABQ5HZ48_9ASTR
MDTSSLSISMSNVQTAIGGSSTMIFTSYSRGDRVPVEYVYESIEAECAEVVTKRLLLTTISSVTIYYDCSKERRSENLDISVAPICCSFWSDDTKLLDAWLNFLYTSLTNHRWRFAHLTLRRLMKRYPYDVLALPVMYTSLTNHRWRFEHLTLRCLMKRYPYDVLALPNLIFRFLQSWNAKVMADPQGDVAEIFQNLGVYVVQQLSIAVMYDKYIREIRVKVPDSNEEFLLIPTTVRRNNRSAQSVDEWTGEQKLQYGDIQYGEIPEDIEFSKPLTAPTYLNHGTQANTTGQRAKALGVVKVEGHLKSIQKGCGEKKEGKSGVSGRMPRTKTRKHEEEREKRTYIRAHAIIWGIERQPYLYEQEQRQLKMA